jgi:endonuclease/exonuclease/phosphatase family metal-dependent hydrolase
VVAVADTLPSGAMASLRVAAYNVHGFRGGTRAIAEVLGPEEPDVLLLNEVGILGFRLWRFRRRMAMHRASGLGRIRPVRNAVLVRRPWHLVGKHVERFPRHGGVQRGVVFALARRAGQRVTLASVHLGLSAREREAHAHHLTDVLAGVPHPVVLGGDLNEGPEGDAASWIAERYWDTFEKGTEGEGHTFPAKAPRARIDYLFVSDGITAERAWVGSAATSASDHLPLFAQLDVGG